MGFMFPFEEKTTVPAAGVSILFLVACALLHGYNRTPFVSAAVLPPACSWNLSGLPGLSPAPDQYVLC